jgi:hypothetical protein
MTFRAVLLAAVLGACLGLIPQTNFAHAESTMSCPSGQYDMLDWMTLDSDLRATQHMTGTANPLYDTMYSDKFYWVKGGNGYPWDIQLYDSNFIYLWITEYSWGDPKSYKKFSNNYNMPLTNRCAKGGFPGSTITVPNTSYEIYTSCSNSTTHDLKQAVNQVWGPYNLSLGGILPKNTPTLVVSYRYNCDSTYNNCGDKEEYYLQQRYGLVQWIHYTLVNGSYDQQQKSVFNTLKSGTATPNFQCF